ncbi:hypothetical protein JF66_01240 [Cryobacterium sp. MLB-32]|uniref:DUF4192 family protein n=1 Tax=Cryobacterium sp. MLB-32 TaxID=1529318 RepID=UPI0004E798B4|nr:hypothetical protein JF66_01240 [Cryobacterium sp. MLB-32]
MQPTIVKTRKASDFLALVPQLVGFLPEQSLVLVAFRGNRTCGALRFNLPDTDAPLKVHKRIATTLVGTLCKIPGVDAVVPVVYTGDCFAAVGGMPQEDFLGCLMKRAEMSGFLVRDALCVAADAWGSYCDPNCPASGRRSGRYPLRRFMRRFRRRSAERWEPCTVGRSSRASRPPCETVCFRPTVGTSAWTRRERRSRN